MKYDNETSSNYQVVFTDVRDLALVCAAMAGILANKGVDVDRLCEDPTIEDYDLDYLRKIANAAWMMKKVMVEEGDL